MEKCKTCQGDRWKYNKRGHRYCADCASKRAAAYNKANPDKRAALAQAWRDEHPTYEKEKRSALKNEVIAGYGGKCVCCGETHLEFLTIDHINGGGNKHRKLLGGSQSFYRMLRDSGYPREEYRLMCMNCNFSRGKYGYCPHERMAE